MEEREREVIGGGISVLRDSEIKEIGNTIWLSKLARTRVVKSWLLNCPCL